MLVTQSCLILCDPRLLNPWDFPGKYTRLGCHFLPQGIFLTQGFNPVISHCRQILYHLSYQGNSVFRESGLKWTRLISLSFLWAKGIWEVAITLLGILYGCDSKSLQEKLMRQRKLSVIALKWTCGCFSNLSSPVRCFLRHAYSDLVVIIVVVQSLSCG